MTLGLRDQQQRPAYRFPLCRLVATLATVLHTGPGMLAATLPAAVDADAGLSLDAYYAAALQRSEVVSSQEELIRQAEEQNRQATAATLPTVSGVASYQWQEPLSTSAPSTSTSLLSRQPLAKIAATQPLFRGFREFAALRQTRALIAAQNEDYQNARVLLYKDVIQNYFNVLSLEQELVNLREQLDQYVQREKELQDRVRIGRSRVGETLSVQTTLSTLRAQIEQRLAELSVARDVFAFLSGLPAATALRDSVTLPDGLEPLEATLARSTLRADVRASQKRLQVAQESVAVARGAHLPSVDLNGNYYFDRPGALKDVDWDVQIAMTVPIYSGGLLSSRTREAESQRSQAELAVSRTQRLADQEIRSLYQSLEHDRAQIGALENATEAARKNVTAQKRDYQLGLVTNLDVLQSLSAYLDNRLALDRARFTAKLDYLRLQAASVRRPAPVEGEAP